jgi:hypothetical protein
MRLKAHGNSQLFDCGIVRLNFEQEVPRQLGAPLVFLQEFETKRLRGSGFANDVILNGLQVPCFVIFPSLFESLTAQPVSKGLSARNSYGRKKEKTPAECWR